VSYPGPICPGGARLKTKSEVVFRFALF